MCKKSVSNNISLKEVWQSLHSEHQTEHRRHGGGDCPKVSWLFEEKSFHVFLVRSVESVDNLFNMDKQLQARLGIKVDQTGRSL